MKSLGSRWSVDVERRTVAIRRRLGLDAGKFAPARGLVLDDSWIPEGIAPFGFDRATRGDAVLVDQLPASGSVDRFRRTVQRFSAVTDAGSLLPVEARARQLVRAAACGTPVVIENAEAYSGVLPPTVLAAFASPTDGSGEFDDRRACRQWGAVFDAFVPSLAATAVTVTVASHRPHYVQRWVDQIARQSHRRLQVVAALHADGFTELDRDHVRRTLGERGVDVVIVDADPAASLGATLDVARRRADGEVIVKWDDDDLYASTHIADLLRARHVSQAPLVGKACDFVYFGGRDVTIRRHQADREAWSPTLSGNTLMIDRDALDAVGGWADQSLGEDVALIARVRQAGGRTYRAAGFGMIAVRHADASQHTWALDADASIDGSVASWPGVAVDEALVDVPAELIDAVRRSAGGGH